MTNTNIIWMNFKDQLHGFILKRVNDSHIADDILQDVFIKVHEGIDKLQDQTKISSWIYQITRNAVIDFYRNKSDNPQEKEVEALLPETGHKLEDEMIRCMKPFIEKLPEKYAEALSKTTFEGVSQKDYAKNIGLSYTATKSRVQRARQMLKSEFTKCCHIESDVYGNIITMKSRKTGCEGQC